MANDKTDKDKKDESKQAGPVAELHVPQIITALHQNAISKCKSQLGSKLRLVNSAIDDSGDKSVLMSTGQHIISVMPTEEAAKAEEDVPKYVAVKVLQTYIQWFIGPDFAKEVNDKTVKSLSEAPDVNDNSKKDKDKLDEHVKPFMKFSQFLREAKTADSDSTDFGDPDDDESSVDFGDNEPEKAHPEDDDAAPDFEKAERRHDPNKKPDKDKQNDDGKKKQNDKQNDGNDTFSTELGYYVTYDLKVEGMKKPAKIDDSMKSMGKSIVNYFKNFFDNVTFTASGLFGGVQSFTVKDVKDKLRQTFGPIDPDELVRNVQDRLDKKFKGSTPHATVSVQDKKTLISDLGTFINGTQQKQIEKADYSLFIKINQDDPKKPILNRGAVANIVQASITGLYKKFKNRLSKDDVIFIPNYRDVHGSTEKLRALYSQVPTPNQLKTEINRARNVNDAVTKIEQRLDKLRRNSLYKECDRADKCYNLWHKFYKDNKLETRSDELSKIANGTEEFNNFFKTVIEQYAKTFNKTEDKNLDESKVFVLTTASLKRNMLQMLFETKIYEDDEKSDSSNNALDVNKLVSRCLNVINKYKVFDEALKKEMIMCMSKKDIKDKIKDFDTSSFDADFGNLKNGILICQKTELLNESSLNDENLKNRIMSILFENKKSKKDKINTNVSKIYSALKIALSDFKISDSEIAKKIFVYELKSLDNSSKDEKKSKNDTDDIEVDFSDYSELNEAKNKNKPNVQSKPKNIPNVVYVLPFGNTDIVNADVKNVDVNNDDNNDDNDNNVVERNDLYIVPMPGLKYEDPEDANQNLK